MNVLGNMTYDGLWNFGSFSNLNYEFTELIIFVIMGAIGGVLGAFHNFVNHKITIFRMRYVSQFVSTLDSILFILDIDSLWGINNCLDKLWRYYAVVFTTFNGQSFRFIFLQ